MLKTEFNQQLLLYEKITFFKKWKLYLSSVHSNETQYFFKSFLNLLATCLAQKTPSRLKNTNRIKFHFIIIELKL